VKKVNVAVIVLSLVLLAGSACVSFVRLRTDRSRAVMYFTSFGTDDVCTEVRYLPKDPIQGDVAFFVDELLLGPMTNRYKPLFARGTRADFCTLEGDTLYVGLSGEALSANKESADIETGIELLKVNIVKKFTKINTVLVYIDGKSVYAES